MKSSRVVESNLPDHDNRPCFCKIILCRANASHSFGIPANFVRAHLPKLMPNSTAVLKGPSADCWSVTVCHQEGKTIMHGWQQFFQDHCLGDNELLLFRHNGYLWFDVQIFGKSGCERKHVSIIRKLQDSAMEIMEEEEEADVTEIGEMEATVQTRKNGERKSTQEKNPGSSSRLQCRTCRKSKAKLCKAAMNQDSAMEIKEDETDIIEIGEMEAPVQTGKNGKRKSTEEKNPASSSRQQCQRGRKSKAKFCKAAMDFNSKFPHFKHCLTKTNVEKPFLLNISTSFVKANVLEATAEFTFRATKQKSWKVTFDKQ